MKKRKKIIILGMILIYSLLLFNFVEAAAWDVDSLNADYNLPGASVTDIVVMLATWLVGIFGFFGIIGFIVSGIMYLVSAGNDEMITKAKTYMLYSIVGVIVGLSGYVIIKALDTLLSATGGI
ncbi:hypothetical protein KJ761_03000 [Patescibacteria group bacterium]|nr:hypothetical protein [Patescibacteria group bacterium]